MSSAFRGTVFLMLTQQIDIFILCIFDKLTLFITGDAVSAHCEMVTLCISFQVSDLAPDSMFKPK